MKRCNSSLEMILISKIKITPKLIDFLNLRLKSKSCKRCSENLKEIIEITKLKNLVSG